MPTYDERPHALYRFYDDEDKLLYVGITLNPGQRWANHRDEKAWWHDVATIKTRHYPSRAAALEAEVEAIRSEGPLHNVVHNRATRPAILDDEGDPIITWKCEICHAPIKVGAGWISIDMRAVMDFEEAWERWEEIHPPGTAIDWHELWRMPHRPSWSINHDTCDPVSLDNYGFGVEDFNTHRKILDWTAHLFNKTWIKATAWDDLIHRAIEGINIASIKDFSPGNLEATRVAMWKDDQPPAPPTREPASSEEGR